MDDFLLLLLLLLLPFLPPPFNFSAPFVWVLLFLDWFCFVLFLFDFFLFRINYCIRFNASKFLNSASILNIFWDVLWHMFPADFRQF